MACAGTPERLTCDGTEGAQAEDARALAALVRDPDKGCLPSGCHGSSRPRAGLRLDSDALVYEEFGRRGGRVYAMLASGEMPRDGTPWSDDELSLLRRWYCAGAFPDE